MFLNGKQQIDKLPGHIRAYGFLFKKAGYGGYGLFIGRYREMIRPEMHQSFVKWRIGSGGGTVARVGLIDIVAADGTTV